MALQRVCPMSSIAPFWEYSLEQTVQATVIILCALNVQEWNEMNHLKIMESLGGDRLWVDRFFAQHAAFVYFWVSETYSTAGSFSY